MHVPHVVYGDSFDADYQFGHPKTYLAPIQLARLTILRSRLGDTRAARAAEHIQDRRSVPDGACEVSARTSGVASQYLT